VTSSLVPIPTGRDEVEHLVPDLVSASSPQAHSWLPVDLADRVANPPAPPDLLDLLYAGKNHVLSGESEAMKTWLAVVAAVEELNAGRGVYWVDGDDVGLDDILERLYAFGIDETAAAERFKYALPDEPLDAARAADVVARLRVLGCRLVVLDGFNPLLTLHGLDPDRGTDVERFYRLLDPLKRLPAAVVLTDNVVKNKESRGKFSIGSERKHSKADVHLGMTTISPLVRGGTGKARIAVHKDRPGHLTRPSAGAFEVDAAGGTYHWTIRPDESHRADGAFRPTGYMEKASRYIERQSEPPSRNQIETNISGKAVHKRAAIDCLIEEGYAVEFTGARSSRLVQSTRPFREDEETER
jgi:hypothetical protein